MSITLPAAVDIPNRISGYAPYSVFFDASATTSTATSYPFHECIYKWSFGDSGSGTWSTDGLSKNKARGPLAAHVYETAGTFTWTLNVKDPAGTTASRSGSITVTAWPNDANTYCFSTTTDFTDAPLNSQHIQTSSFATIIGYADTNRRLLLHAGQTWTTSGDNSIDVSGPGIIGKFGTGSNPVIICSGATVSPMKTGADWRIMDLVFNNNSGTNNTDIISIQAIANTLILRCEAYGKGHGVGVSWPDYTELIGNAIVDSYFHDLGTPWIDGWGIYCGGAKYAIMGCTIEHTGSHCLRIFYTYKSVVSHNHIHDPNREQVHAIKFHQDEYLTSEPAHYSVISNNVISNDPYGGWTVVIGPSNEESQIPNPDNEQGQDIIFERNIVRCNYVGVILVWERMTCRNNIFTSAAGEVCIAIEPWDTISNNVWVYNNTFYSLASHDTNTFIVINVSTSSTNVIARNNLASLPNWENKVMVQGNPTEDHNRLTDTPGFVNAGADNFHLLVTSEAIDQGYNVTSIYEDYDLGVITGTKDQGAFEYGAIPEDEGQSSLPSMVGSRRRRHE